MRLTRTATRLLALLVALDLAAAIVAAGVLQADPTRASAAGIANQRVVVIVGPVGPVTDDYRAMADDAVATAHRFTDNVVAIYSPDATWPAVRKALQGATMVVYLGHGNGWPSRYSSSLVRATQDGLGLNPVAGVDDSAHQYFGEAPIARDVRLAPGAVVIFSHLCYASGAAEPGMANPTLAIAEQRVDNYAAGWLTAGASAVIADGYGAPAPYVRALLGGGATPQAAWNGAPMFHGHVVGASSVRTPGATLQLDPDQSDSGYHRSLVQRPGATSLATVPATSAVGAADATAGLPTLAGPGSSLAAVDLQGPVVAGSGDQLVVTFDRTTGRNLPKVLTIGTRWTTIAVDGDLGPVPQDDAAAVPGPSAGTPAGQVPAPDASIAAIVSGTPGASGAPGLSSVPTASGGPTAALAPDASGVPADPPVVDLVVPETPATVVAATAAVGTGLRRTAQVTLPSVPGTYRLVTTLHDGDGVAYDAATQDLLPALIVRVTGRLWASYGALDEATATAGQPAALPIRIGNTGSDRWGPTPIAATADPEPGHHADPSPHLVARWLPLDLLTTGVPAVETPGVSARVDPVTPGDDAIVVLEVSAPPEAGHYLLVLDLVTADGVSLAASGVPPGVIRVEVRSAGPSATPDARLGGS